MTVLLDSLVSKGSSFFLTLNMGYLSVQQPRANYSFCIIINIK